MKSKFVSGLVLTLVLIPLVRTSPSEVDTVQTSLDSDAEEELRPDDQDSITTWKISDQLKDHTVAEFDEDLSIDTESVDVQDSFTTWKTTAKLKDQTEAEFDEDLSIENESVDVQDSVTTRKTHTEAELDAHLSTDAERVLDQSDLKLIEGSSLGPYDYSDVVKALNKSADIKDDSQLRNAKEPEKGVNKQTKKISKPLQMKYESSEGNRVTAAMFFTGLLVWFTAVAFILD